MIYLDHAATTPVAEQVLEAMLPYYCDKYGNPSGGYCFAKDTKHAIEEARGTIARIIGAKKHEIYFTSGGTESDNWAVKLGVKCVDGKGDVMSRPYTRPHVITTQIEHHAVLNACKYLEEQGIEVTYLPVNEYGEVSLQCLQREIRPETVLISVMYANNEVGTIQRIEEIGRIAAAHQICFHTDAVQAFGQVPIDVKRQHISMLSASAHKCYGPKGVGFLYISEDLQMPSFVHGGGQERGLRAGTENAAGIVGFAKAGELCVRYMYPTMRRERELRDYFLRRIGDELPQVKLNGYYGKMGNRRMPGNVHICIPGTESGKLVDRLDRAGICVSGGSACSSANLESSHVLQAMGISEELARGALRMTLGMHTTKKDLDYTIEQLKLCLEGH